MTLPVTFTDVTTASLPSSGRVSMQGFDVLPSFCFIVDVSYTLINSLVHVVVLSGSEIAKRKLQ